MNVRSMRAWSQKPPGHHPEKMQTPVQAQGHHYLLLASDSECQMPTPGNKEMELQMQVG